MPVSRVRIPVSPPPFFVVAEAPLGSVPTTAPLSVDDETSRFPCPFSLTRSILFACVFFCLLMGGCVKRTLEIRTEPSGAKVFLDGAYRGETPVSLSFDHYGTRELVVRAPAFATLRTRLKLSPPWFQRLGLDFLCEILLPVTLEDRHSAFLLLAAPPPRDEKTSTASLANRAAELRAPRR